MFSSKTDHSFIWSLDKHLSACPGYWRWKDEGLALAHWEPQPSGGDWQVISSVLCSVWGSTEHPTLGMAVGGAKEDTGGEVGWPEGSQVREKEGG